MDILSMTVCEWSRLQFGVTACYHWIFVPLTLGLIFIVSLMETVYVVTKDDFWKKLTKFWMKLFAINFAIGIATGIILEFQFGTNWSNYSWFVGDIFGAPLAIEGIVAFFMEATFFAVMFFGWDKISKKLHLAATWLTTLGTMISGFWIIVANAWMQHPTGTTFNIDMLRNEMISFGAVVSNPIAMVKYIHAIMSGWLTGSIFVIAVSCWFILRKRQRRFAYSSILVAGIVGLLGCFGGLLSGHESAVDVAKYQPMKLAAMENLQKGGRGVALTLIPGIKIPKMLSILATFEPNGFVPGIEDIKNGYTDNDGTVVPPAKEKIRQGKLALNALGQYLSDKAKAKSASSPSQKSEFEAQAQQQKEIFEKYSKYQGYGYLNSPDDLVPNVPFVFITFRLMVFIGMFYFLVLILIMYLLYKKQLESSKWRWFLQTTLWTLPLVFLCGQAGWIVAEVGRQPWTVQGLLTTSASVSAISATAVATTLILLALVFVIFLIIEVRIMFRAVQKGPDIQELNDYPIEKTNNK